MTSEQSHRSPFPGMDPYLEDRWGDVHTCMIVFARQALRTQLPEGLKARIEEYVSLHFAEDHDRRVNPDVRVVEAQESARGAAPSSAAVAEPIVVPRVVEPETLRVLRILDSRRGDRVVTTIELLSPANKTPAGAEEFRRKQEALVQGGVSVVEVDLLRRGHYVLSAPFAAVPSDYRTPYRACVVEASAPDVAKVYHFSLRDRLPAIAIPLRKEDEPARLDLQQLVDAAYREGEHWDTDYTRDPDPPLDPDDAAWADELLRAAGKR